MSHKTKTAFNLHGSPNILSTLQEDTTKYSEGMSMAGRSKKRLGLHTLDHTGLKYTQAIFHQ